MSIVNLLSFFLTSSFPFWQCIGAGSMDSHASHSLTTDLTTSVDAIRSTDLTKYRVFFHVWVPNLFMDISNLTCIQLGHHSSTQFWRNNCCSGFSDCVVSGFKTLFRPKNIFAKNRMKDIKDIKRGIATKYSIRILFKYVPTDAHLADMITQGIFIDSLKPIDF